MWLVCFSFDGGGGDGFGDGLGAGGLVGIEGAVGAGLGPGGGVGVLAVVLVFLLQAGDLGFQLGELRGHGGLPGLGLGVRADCAARSDPW